MGAAGHRAGEVNQPINNHENYPHPKPPRLRTRLRAGRNHRSRADGLKVFVARLKASLTNQRPRIA